jgi:hypothetical protein
MVRILFTHCDNLYGSFVHTLSTVSIPTVDLSREARAECSTHTIVSSWQQPKQRAERERIYSDIILHYFFPYCQTNTSKNPSIDDGVPTVSQSLMCVPTMRFIVMILPLLLMLLLLRPNNDAVCVGLCASAGVVIGARVCPQQECCPRPQGIVCATHRVPSNGACGPCPLLGTLSCLSSSWLSVIVSHDGQLILLYSL